MASIGDFFRDAGQAASNTAASTVSAPVDAIAWALRKAGVPVGQPVGGSDWMAAQGLTAEPQSDIARAFGETAAMVAPIGAAARGPELARAALAAMEAAPVWSAGSRALPSAQGGVISPEGKARLLRDLQAGQPSGSYVLGDITPGQAKALERVGGRPMGTDVLMTDGGLQHILESRVQRDGFSPEDVAEFVTKAMERRSKAWIDPAARHPNPGLVNFGVLDPKSGGRYDATLPLRPTPAGGEVVTVVPRGIGPKKNKTPRP